MCAFLMLLFFTMDKGDRDFWGIWVKVLGFVGMLFINWKVKNNKVCQVTQNRKTKSMMQIKKSTHNQGQS